MSDYYEPADPKAGTLERRMLYLLHQLTFKGYYAATYADVLKDHITRVTNVSKEPSHIQALFPDPANTIALLQDFLTAMQKLNEKVLNTGSLRELCERSFNVNAPEWQVAWEAAKKVNQDGILVPFLHANRASEILSLFSPAYKFLDEDEGWGKYPVHVLLSTNKSKYAGSSHIKRLSSLTKAKKCCVVRPSQTLTTLDGTGQSPTKGNHRCCNGINCQDSPNAEKFCIMVDGECSILADPCF